MVVNQGSQPVEDPVFELNEQQLLLSAQLGFPLPGSKQYTVEELQYKLLKVLQLNVGFVQCTEKDQYVIGYTDQTVSFMQTIKKVQRRYYFENLVKWQAPVKEEQVMQLFIQNCGIEMQPRPAVIQGANYLQLHIAQQVVVQQKALPYFIARLPHVRFKLLPLICATIAARLQISGLHLRKNGVRLWKFLQLGNSAVVGPRKQYEVYSGTILLIVEIMQQDDSARDLEKQIITVIDQFDMWLAGVNMPLYLSSLSKFPQPSSYTKAYLHGMMDTSGSLELRNRSDRHALSDFKYGYRFTGEARFDLAHRLGTVLSAAMSTTRRYNGNQQHKLQVYGPKQVLQLVEFATKKRGCYPFMRQAYFSQVKDIAELLDKGLHKTENGWKCVMDMYGEIAVMRKQMGPAATAGKAQSTF